jgi:hypothetical protein
MRSRNRGVGMFVAAAAILGACSSSGDSSVSTDAATESTSRARNTLAAFGADGSGVARNLITPLKLSLLAYTTDQVQQDGSTLLGVLQLELDGTGVRIALILQRLIGAAGAVDPTFGTDGKVRITLNGLNETTFRITKNGHVYTTTSVTTNDDNVVIQLVRRYVAATGALDTTFGNAGQLPLPNMVDGNNQTVAITEDNNGNILVLDQVRDAETTVLQHRLTRIPAEGTLDSFGESEGSTVFSFDPLIEEGLSQQGVVRTQQGCTLIALDNGKIDVLCMAHDLKTQSDGTSADVVRRGLQRMSFESNGTRSLIPAESRENEVWWLDAQRADSNLGELRIADVDELGDGVLSVVLEGKNFSQGTHVLLTREMTNTNVEDNGDNILMPNIVADGTGVGNMQFVRQVRFISSAEPALAGIYVDSERDEQGLLISSFETQALIQRIALGKYPVVFHRPSPIHLDAPGQPNFAFDALGLDLFGMQNIETAITNVRNNSGFMALNTNGEARPTYSNGTSFVKSPISLADSVDGTGPSFPFEAALLAGNNNDFYVLGGVWGEDSALAIKHFDGNNQQIGDVVVTSGLNFSTSFPMTAGKAVIDANNNIYVAGFASMPGTKPGSLISGPGVAKFSLETGAVDTTFGENGFAFLQRIDSSSTDFVEFEEWVNVSLVGQTDGNIDVINAEITTDEENPNLSEMNYSVRRISPTGDVANTQQYFFELPGSGLAQIRADIISSVFGATVDPQGRFVTSNISLVTVPDPESDDPTATDEVPFMKVTRYLADGTVDTSFGDNGVGGFKFDDVAFVQPMEFAHVRVQADGRILVGFTGLGLSFKEELALLGEEHFMVRLTANGKLDEVTPPEISPEAEAARDALPPIGIEQAPAVQLQVPPAIATSGNAQLAASYEGTQVTKDGRLAITTLGVSADRAVAVKWAVPESLSTRKLKYTVTAQPSGRTCSTATTTCVFKNLNPWTTYTFTVKVVSVAAVGALSSAKSAPVKPLRVVLRGSSTPTAKLITPASKGAQSWKVKGGCILSKDKKTFTATPDGAMCTLALTTAKSGKTPKITRSISVFVKVVAP